MTKPIDPNYPVYLDCNATTPVESTVLETVIHFLKDDYGNEGSRTHSFGSRAKQAVQKARNQVASLVGAKREEVIFTSGATESNNLALLGMRGFGEANGKKHIVSSEIEHKAVLEPLEFLRTKGFETTLVKPNKFGLVDAHEVAGAVRKDTLLVSLMQVNNETGVIQPVREVARLLGPHECIFHVDGAQGFGKELNVLSDPRIDLISISGHKIFAPKGIGALVVRRRGYSRVPLSPIGFGGGQERGLRPGTLPVALIAALGEAAELAIKDHSKRVARCLHIKALALASLEAIGAQINGSKEHTIYSTLNIRFPGIDSEAVIVAVKHLIAISNGSACTSSSYTPSHVMLAMGMTEKEATECVRLSWCHLTPDVDWARVSEAIVSLRG